MKQYYQKDFSDFKKWFLKIFIAQIYKKSRNNNFRDPALMPKHSWKDSLGIQALLSSENTELGAGKISMVQFDCHSLWVNPCWQALLNLKTQADMHN